MPSPNKPTFVKLKPRNPKPTTSPKAEPTTKTTVNAEVTETSEVSKNTETNTSNTTSQKSETFTTPDDSLEDSTAIFQAIGVVTGEVHFADDGQATLTIGKKDYQLFYVSSKRKAFDALRKEITATEKHQQRLVVYPKITHFPKKNQHHQIAFQLIAFDKGECPKGISQQLQDNEFQLRGLWQFIPACRFPCISVMKNFSKERLDYINKADLFKKVKFLKASHIPISWKDAPIKPFRFNPKAGKEQGHPAFVQIKAKFVPQRNTFTFLEQLAPSSENSPQFLKASKEDKISLKKSQKSP